MILGMNHFTAVAEDPQKTLAFYEGLIGLKKGPRPDLGFDGAWLYADPAIGADAGGQGAGDQAILHLYFDRPAPTPRTGVIDHMAFTAHDLKAVKARFDAAGYHYTLKRQAGSGTWQLFCFDPTGARVELDFAASESL